MRKHLLLTAGIFFLTNLSAKIWQVGPGRTYTQCTQVALLVQNGDTVDIDAATYTNVVQVSWAKNNLFIRGVNGKPILIAGSTIANDMSNGKGIFVIDGTNITIENIDFRNAKVQSHNGAGIRIQAANVMVRHCVFNGNEMGILGGNIANCTIIVEYCEFLNGGSTADPGYQHNIYINHVDSFIFRFNHSYDAIAEGHELKSRATFNLITYNRISNVSTTDSRNIDLPNGGTAIIMGNIIEQGPNSTNSNLLGYGLEGLTNTGPHNLWICNNTFVNKKDKGSFINVPTSGMDTLFLKNNIMAGAKTGGLIIGTPGRLDSAANLISDSLPAFGFKNPDLRDFHLTAESRAINAGSVITKVVNGHLLVPVFMYLNLIDKEPRPVNGVIDIGAFEFSPASSTNDNELYSNTFLVYPNPAHGYCFITFPGQASSSYIKIYNTLGKELLCTNATGKISVLNIETLEPGIYVITVQIGIQTRSAKLVISE